MKGRRMQTTVLEKLVGVRLDEKRLSDLVILRFSRQLHHFLNRSVSAALNPKEIPINKKKERNK